MKSILTLLICIISLYSSAQCVKLYIQEHIGGSPICNLSAGDYIEICEDENEVNGCPRNFYIYDKGYESGSLTYELSLDRGWNTHYMTLMVNPKNKRIGFSLQGQNGVYSYITENEMELIRAKQEEQQAIENQKRVELAKLQDEKRHLLIDQLYLEKKIEAAKNEMDKLNYPQNYKNKKNIDTEYLSFTKAKKEREAIEDLVTINDIRRLLNSNDIVKVVQSWVSLHSKTNLQNIKDSIFQFILRNETGNVPVSLTNSDLPKFIELNKVQIGNSYKSITKDTNIIIQFDQLGKCLQNENYTWNSTVFKKYSDDFFTYQTLKIPVSLKIKDTKIEKKAELLYAGTKKTLALSRKGNIYKLNLLSADIIDLTTWKQNYDEKLPKNEVRIEVFFTRNLFANDIIIDSKEILKSNNQKLNPRTLRKVGRIATITAILGWFGLRIMENQSIK